MGQHSDSEQRQGIERQGPWMASILVDFFVSGRSLTTGEVEHFEGIGRARAGDGETFDAALAALDQLLDLGYRSLPGSLVERSSRPAGTSLADISVGLMRLRLEMTEAFARGFVRERADRPQTSAGTASGFVSLLVRAPTGRHGLRVEAGLAGLDPDESYGMVVAMRHAQGDVPRLRRLLEELTMLVPGAVGSEICRSPIAHAVVLHRDRVAPADLAVLASDLARRRGLALAALRTSPLEALASRYRRLRGHLAMVGMLAQEGQFLASNELSFYEVLGSTPADSAETLVREHLGGILALPPSRSKPLLSTLRAFFSVDGNVAKTARLLQLHPKGAAYRLNRVATLTGLRPHSVRDGLRIQLALHLLDMHRVSLPPLGDEGWSERS